MISIDEGLNSTHRDGHELLLEPTKRCNADLDEQFDDLDAEWYAENYAQPAEDDFEPTVDELRALDARARRVFKVGRTYRRQTIATARPRRLSRGLPRIRRARRRARRVYRARRRRASTGRPADDPYPPRLYRRAPSEGWRPIRGIRPLSNLPSTISS